MEIGNRWQYADGDTETFFNANGTVVARGWHGRTEIVQVGWEELHGRRYMRESIGIPDTVLTGGGVRWRREDRTGLYEFGPLPRGTAPNAEKKLLEYPLHTGATWPMYQSSMVADTAFVEGMDVLNLPAGRFPAWRIRIHGASQPPSVVWYGREGFLMEKWHADYGRASGNGFRVVKDHADSLTWLRLAGR
jgi:hypothetical protein